MNDITLNDPLREVYLLDTPDGKHYCPKWLKHYRAPATDGRVSLPPQRRLVKVDLVKFEDSTNVLTKLVVPIVHALMAGPEAVLVVYIIMTPDPKTFTGIITLDQYQNLPIMEIEGV